MKIFRFLLVVAAFVNLFAFAPASGAAQSDDEYEIFRLINNERSRSRLGPLEWDDELAHIARRYSRQMAREGFFSHHDRDGRSVVERAEKARWSSIGENLFMCEGLQDFTTFSVRGWMKSPSHRKNILTREWTDTGIGVYRTRDDRVYVTQVFVRR